MVHFHYGENVRYDIPTSYGTVRATYFGTVIDECGAPCSVCGKNCKTYLSFTGDEEQQEVIVGMTCADKVQKVLIL